MAKSQFIARQSAHPTGWFGHVVARVMARDTARANRAVLERLEAKPGEKILELGCGHGRTLREVSRQTEGGFAAGVDPSEVMLSVARQHLRHGISFGRVQVETGNAGAIPFPDAAFDKAFSVHTLYFWSDLDEGSVELRRVLRPGGELLLGFHDGADELKRAELPDNIYTLHTAEAISASLEAAGFREIAVEHDDPTGLSIARARR